MDSTAEQETLNDAFYETLKDVFYAEKQSVRALKKSAKAAAENREWKQAFETHAEASAQQVERLQQVFEIIDKPASQQDLRGDAGAHGRDGRGPRGFRRQPCCGRPQGLARNAAGSRAECRRNGACSFASSWAKFRTARYLRPRREVDLLITMKAGS